MYSLQLMPAIFAESLAHKAGADALAWFLICFNYAVLAHAVITPNMD